MKKNSFISLLILFFIYILFCIFLYGKYGSIIHDCFREAIIPEWILEGKIMYKDIINLYPPLGYYLNAFLYKIFGIKLSVLYAAGFLNGLIIWLCVYHILKEISDIKTALVGTITTLLIFIFRINEADYANYIFPYSYSLIYAFSACFMSYLCFIFYKSRKNIKFLYASFFFMGLSITFKLDYLLLVILLFAYLFIKERTKKNIFISLIMFIIPFLFSAFLCCLNGVEFNDILSHFKFLEDFSKNPYVIDFNNSMPQKLDFYLIKMIIKSFGYFILNLGLFYCISYGLCKLFKSFPMKKIYNYIFGSILIVTIIELLFIYQKSMIRVYMEKVVNVDYCTTFVFLSYLLLMYAVFIFIKNKIKKQSFSINEKIFCLLLIVSYLISYRNYAGIYISCIGNFTIVSFWMAFIFLLYKLLPENMKLLNNDIYKNALTVALLIYSIIFFISYISRYQYMQYKYSYDKGDIWVSRDYKAAFHTGMTHAKENIKDKNKKLLCVDEGLYIHYFLDIPIINEKMYFMHSHFVPVLGEDYIIKEIEKYQPDYIYKFVHSDDAQGEFGINYGKKVYDYILENYTLIEEQPKYKHNDINKIIYKIMIFENNNNNK